MLAAVVSLLFRGESDVMVQELAKLSHLVGKEIWKLQIHQQTIFMMIRTRIVNSLSYRRGLSI